MGGHTASQGGTLEVGEYSPIVTEKRALATVKVKQDRWETNEISRTKDWKKIEGFGIILGKRCQTREPSVPRIMWGVQTERTLGV